MTRTRQGERAATAQPNPSVRSQQPGSSCQTALLLSCRACRSVGSAHLLVGPASLRSVVRSSLSASRRASSALKLSQLMSRGWSGAGPPSDGGFGIEHAPKPSTTTVLSAARPNFSLGSYRTTESADPFATAGTAYRTEVHAFVRSAANMDCKTCSEISFTAPGECDRKSVLVLSLSPIDLIVSKYCVTSTSCMTSEVEATPTTF